MAHLLSITIKYIIYKVHIYNNEFTLVLYNWYHISILRLFSVRMCPTNNNSINEYFKEKYINVGKAPIHTYSTGKFVQRAPPHKPPSGTMETDLMSVRLIITIHRW